MTTTCNQINLAGKPCAYPADWCPIHESEPAEVELAVAEDAAAPHSSKSLRAIGQLAVEGVVDGTASPLQASRLIKSLSAVNELGDFESDEERDKILSEIELRGLIMHGCTPRTPEEWLLARQIFDDEGFEEFVRWERCGDGWGNPDKSWMPPIPEHLLPPRLRGPQPRPDANLKLSRYLPNRAYKYYLANGWETDDWGGPE